MNRRNFLKRCSLLPFVGSLAVVAKADNPLEGVHVEILADGVDENDLPAFRSPLSQFYEKAEKLGILEDKSKPYMTATEIKERWDEKMACFNKKGIAYVIEWPNKIIILDEQKRS